MQEKLTEPSNNSSNYSLEQQRDFELKDLHLFVSGPFTQCAFNETKRTLLYHIISSAQEGNLEKSFHSLKGIQILEENIIQIPDSHSESYSWVDILKTLQLENKIFTVEKLQKHIFYLWRELQYDPETIKILRDDTLKNTTIFIQHSFNQKKFMQVKKENKEQYHENLKK